ncbi:hypothetical protein GCM10011320_55390 [Neoroseomonas lacus]|uniref:N-acetyltransferase domain-containing protein n=1 Tax=Neoroseomonas lacus TaxID=287609 RepID=A0A917L1R6_9PROT|nr:hypothetical protein GCM10011320_55390 [Neoroseomonas lacus]
MDHVRESIGIRPMARGDVPELLRLMRSIVNFERGTDFQLTEAHLLAHGFGKKPGFGAYVADRGGGALAGMAVHYEIPFMHNLRPLLMMKWLFVDPQVRGGRIGRRLMQRMALHAQETGHDKICWFVLKDNSPAQGFYRGIGATPDHDWDRWVLTADALEIMANGG